MKATGPLFKWFGAKWNASKHYPPPAHGVILEPYAGSAAYALRHAGDRAVVLFDDDPNLIPLWEWLISDATEAAIREIPIGLPVGTNILELGLSRGQALLLKHWQRTNNVGDCWITSPWGHMPGQWTANTRARVAEEVALVKRWQFRPPTWSRTGTWFIDPPYEFNYRYRTGKTFDHAALAKRVRALRGQIIVCEARDPKDGRIPKYLPFTDFRSTVTSRRKTTEHHHSREVIYIT